MTLITRRSALLGLLAAPVIVRVSSLMSVVPVPQTPPAEFYYRLERRMEDGSSDVAHLKAYDGHLVVGTTVNITGGSLSGLWRVAGYEGAYAWGWL